MSILQKVIAGAVGALAFTTAASAAPMTIGYTEGVRPTVPGTVNINGDAPNSPSGFDLNRDFDDNSFDAGDQVNLFGRVVGNNDFYQITSTTVFDILLVGLEREGSPNNIELEFTLVDLSTMSIVSTMSAQVGDDPLALFSSITSGSYQLLIRRLSQSGAALYDLQFVSEVPLPAALPLFLAGIAGLGFAKRPRKQTA